MRLARCSNLRQGEVSWSPGSDTAGVKRQNLAPLAAGCLGAAMSECQHDVVYAPCLWGGGYNIKCRKCGDVYGFSASADPAFLAGFSRPQHTARTKSLGRREKSIRR